MVSSSAGQMDSLALSSRAEDLRLLPLLGALPLVAPCAWLRWPSHTPSCWRHADSAPLEGHTEGHTDQWPVRATGIECHRGGHKGCEKVSKCLRASV